MTRKKVRQTNSGSPGGDDSSESGEDQTQASGKSCPHTQKGVDSSGFRKSWAKLIIHDACADCSKDSSKSKKNEESATEKEKEEDENNQTSMWLCLKCGYQACGPPRNKSSHIAKHCDAPRSDCHAMCIDTERWDVWCQKCEIVVSNKSTKRVQDMVEMLKRKHRGNAADETVDKRNNLKLNLDKNEVAEGAIPTDRETPKLSGSKTVTLATSSTQSSPSSMHPKVKGLTNLGNTCFFNAVLQCLAQTPFLVPMLKETEVEGEAFYLPGIPKGGKGQELQVPALKGISGKWGRLTEALAETLTEMQEPGGSGVVTPRKLHDVISSKASYLMQGDQQDSQELLRHLVEGVRAEELKRFQMVILKSMGLSIKTDPSTTDDVTKAKAKVYNQQASQLLLRPDQLFQGRLISILECQNCKHQSCTPECFLDLSLPIAFEKHQYSVGHKPRRKSKDSEPELTNNETNSAPSKQPKKEKRHANNSHRTPGSRQHPIEPGDKENDGDGNNREESKQCDADVEDNEDQESQTTHDEMLDSSVPKNTTNCITSTQDEPLVESPTKGKTEKDLANKDKALDTLKAAVEDRGGGESGYATNGGTHSNSPGSPNSATEEQDPKCASPSALCTGLALIALGDERSNGSHSEKADSKAEDMLDEKIDEKPEKVKEEEGACAPEVEQHEELEEEEASAPKVEQHEELEEEEASAPKVEQHEELEEEHEDSHFEGLTLTQRPSPSDTEGEYSIQSCLYQFAAIELLTNNNKVSCKNCTKKAGKNAQGKSVYTNSTKQLLVSAPPAILTLHLKRFEVYGSRFRKVSRSVSFPLILDIASICSVKCRKLPSVGENQTKILYSLYGIVEHSGGLAGGHYVAYVKARTQPDKDDPRSKFLLSNPWEQPEQRNIAKNNEVEEGAEGGFPEPPPGKWYCISDSRVSEVAEKKVLQTQAYLLFYERIF